MKILDIVVLKGPNYWSVRHKVIVALVDIGKFEEIPSDKIDGLHIRLQKLMPGLYDHHCSEDKSGGFLERVKSGTWIGHIVEHIALELQNMAGMDCGFGRTRNSDQTGIYYVVINYELERAGIFALESAVKIAEALFNGTSYPIEDIIDTLKKIAFEDQPGPSTMAIIKAAETRGIPWMRLDNRSMVQLGYGKAQQRIEATTTDNTSSIAVDLASDKFKTKQILMEASIPVPSGTLLHDEAELEGVLHATGFPVVIKPYNKNQGKGVTLNIHSSEAAFHAFRKAKSFSDGVLVEKHIHGNDYRLLVINYKLVAAAQRTPAMVTGDNTSTISQLVQMVNLDPRRGMDHENALTRIVIDQVTTDLLSKEGLTPDYIPKAGTKLYLKQTANLSTGGTSEDVTDYLHPEIITMAERVARIIGLDICGIDIIAEDISKPLSNGHATVIEVNAAPGFRMHTFPSKGKPRPVGEAVVNMLFPGDTTGRIPITAITGTNGKTTTALILAHIARSAGFHAGLTTTEGIYIGKDMIIKGDCAGPESARSILSDRSVDYAVLECARGGILKGGLGFDRCHIGIVTNVSSDHLGLKGINSIDEMASVKSVVAESVSGDGLAILNGNDPYCYSMRTAVHSAFALFSIDGASKGIKEHINNGGIAAVYKDKQIKLIKGNQLIFSEYIDNIPVTYSGKASFMIENVMAATIAAWYSGIESEIIREALRDFMPDFEHTPGRLNLIHFSDFSCILDYAHNPHGIAALGSFIKEIEASEKVGIITSPGDRRNEDILETGRISAEIFDKIIIRLDEDTRGRKAAEIIDLLHKGILSSRNKKIPLEVITSEAEAVSYALENAVRGSLITILSENIYLSLDIIKKFQRKESEPVTITYPSESEYVLRLGKNNIFEYTKRNTGSARR